MGVPRFWANWRKRSRSRSVSLMVSPSRLSSPRPIWNTNVPMRISSETGCEGAFSAPGGYYVAATKVHAARRVLVCSLRPRSRGPRCAARARRVLSACRSGCHDYALYLPRELEAADAGHHDVETARYRTRAPHGGARRLGVLRRRHAKALRIEIAREKIARSYGRRRRRAREVHASARGSTR